MKHALQAIDRERLAATLASRGEIAVAAVVGSSPTTLRKARSGAPVNASTAYAIRAFLREQLAA